MLASAAPVARAQQTPAAEAGAREETQSDVQAEPKPDSTLAAVKVNASAAGDDARPNSYIADTTSTATRMNLSPRDTPQSVTVITGQQIRDTGATSVSDVLAQAVGIVVQKYDEGRPVYYARGFEVQNFQVDGVPIAFNSIDYSVDLDSIILDRVDVLKGATGLTTGSGDPSATVNLIHKRPTKDFTASADVSAGSYDFYRSSADLSGRLNASGTIRGRIAVAGTSARSFLDAYRKLEDAVSAAIDADLTSHTKLTVGIDNQTVNTKGAQFGGPPAFYADGTRAAFSPSFNVTTDWSRWNSHYQNTYIYLEHRFDNDWKLRLAYSHMQNSADAKLFSGSAGYPDESGGGLVARTLAYKDWQKQDTIDLYATGPFTLLGRRHELVVGFNGYRRNLTTPTETAVVPDGYNVIPNYNTWSSSGYPEYPVTEDGSRIDTLTEEWGTYAALRLNVSDRLKVIGGLRVSTYETHTDNYGVGGVFTSRSGDYAQHDIVTPYAGFVFDLSDAVSWYGSYTSIFQPQTYRDANNQLLKPATGKNFESGFKAQFFDGALDATAAYFVTKQDNIAEVDGGQTLPDGSQAYQSVSGTTTRGYEFELTGSITPNWQVYGGYTRAVTRDASGMTINTYRPRDTAHLTTAYQFGGHLKRLRVGGGLTWQSAIYYDYTPYSDAPSTLTSQRIFQPSYALVNLFGSYQVNRHVSVALNVNNLFDRRYYSQIAFYNDAAYGTRRSIVGTVRYKF